MADRVIILPAPSSNRKTAWDYLNSPFALFLLTSLVLGGVSFAYNEYSLRQRKREDKVLRISHLLTELKFRSDIISSLVQPEFTYTAMFSANGAMLGDRGNKSMDGNYIGSYTPIFQEFVDRNMISLIWELEELEAGNPQKAELHRCLDTVTRLKSEWNDDLKMLLSREEGQNDSIWHFSDTQHLEQYKADVVVLRSGLGRIDDPTSSSP